MVLRPKIAHTYAFRYFVNYRYPVIETIERETINVFDQSLNKVFEKCFLNLKDCSELLH